MLRLLKTRIGLAVSVFLIGGIAQADTVTIGPNGINSAGLADAQVQVKSSRFVPVMSM